MSRLYRKLLHAIDNRGFRGLIRHALRRLIRKPDASPSFHEPDEPHPFDRLHATDTSGFIPGEQLAASSASDLYNTAYYAISPSTLAQALELIPEPLARFTFVDLGCGKGRALLVAAQFGFAAILGVEISPELCAIARANTASIPRVGVQQADAASVIYPDAPLVVYFYHPFLTPMLRRVIANLQRQSGQTTFVLYANCRYDKAMARIPSLEVVWDYNFPLSPEDAAADRHGTTVERFTLYRIG